MISAIKEYFYFQSKSVYETTEIKTIEDLIYDILKKSTIYNESETGLDISLLISYIILKAPNRLYNNLLQNEAMQVLLSNFNVKHEQDEMLTILNAINLLLDHGHEISGGSLSTKTSFAMKKLEERNGLSILENLTEGRYSKDIQDLANAIIDKYFPRSLK